MSKLSSDLMSSTPQWLDQFYHSYWLWFYANIWWEEKSVFSITQLVLEFCLRNTLNCLKFLPNLFIVNAMSSIAKRWINQLRSFAYVTPKRYQEQVNFEVWLSKLSILIDQQNLFLSCVWTGSCKRRYCSVKKVHLSKRRYISAHNFDGILQC